MNRQHNLRRNQQRERQKSLKYRLAENRLHFEFLQKTQQLDIDDEQEAENVPSESSKD